MKGPFLGGVAGKHSDATDEQLAAAGISPSELRRRSAESQEPGKGGVSDLLVLAGGALGRGEEAGSTTRMGHEPTHAESKQAHK